MFIPRVFCAFPLATAQSITLDNTAEHYLLNVLRLKNQSAVILFDGVGGEYSATLSIIGKKVHAHIHAFIATQREALLSLHLGQTLVRGDRMDWVIQKATELGVHQLTPLLTAHCAVKLDEARSKKRLHHWQQIAISASEQCGRTQLPIIHPPLPLQEWVKQNNHVLSLIFEPTSHCSLKNIPPAKAIRLAIGPESGWSHQEIALMQENGFMCCSLGPRILRTETAAITAISLLQGLYGDLA